MMWLIPQYIILNWPLKNLQDDQLRDLPPANGCCCNFKVRNGNFHQKWSQGRVTQFPFSFKSENYVNDLKFWLWGGDCVTFSIFNKGVAVGDKGRLECEIEVDGDEELDWCFWVSPRGERYYSGDDPEFNKEVVLRQRRSFADCTLLFDSLKDEDAGHWECAARLKPRRGRSRSTKGKFAFVQIQSKEKFGVLVDPDDAVIYKRVGQSVDLLCPTNGNNYNPSGKRPFCRWFAPFNERAHEITDK